MEKKKGISRDLTKIIVCAVLIVIAILLFVDVTVMEYVAMILAIAFIAYGAISVIVFAVHKKQGKESKNLVLPVIALVIGVLMLVFDDATAYIALPVAVGVWMVVDGITDFAALVRLRQMYATKNRPLLVAAVAAVVAGVMLIATGLAQRFAELPVLTAILFIVYGVTCIMAQAVLKGSRKRNLA